MTTGALRHRVETRLREGAARAVGPLLAAGVVLTLVTVAVAVAYSAHKSRAYLNELTQLEEERDRLEVEWGQLLLEQHTWGAYGRIGRLASEQLQMRNPAPAEIIMVRQ